MSAILTHKLDQWLLLIYWGTYVFSVTTTGRLGYGGLLSDYYRHLWHTTVGSVTTIGTSGKQTLGQWLLLELLAHRERFSGHYRHLLLTKARLLTAIGLFPHIDFFSDYYWSSGARRLVQWLLLTILTHRSRVIDWYGNFWHTEVGSVTTINTFCRKNLGYWLLSELLSNRGLTSGFYCSSGTERLRKWLLSKFLAHRCWIGGNYYQICRRTEAPSMTTIGFLAHRGWLSDHAWNFPAHRDCQIAFLTLIDYRDWFKDYYRNFWRTEKGSVVTIGTFGTQRVGYWLLLICWHTVAGPVIIYGTSSEQSLCQLLLSGLLAQRG